MLDHDGRFWVGVLVGILGLAAGGSNLVRGLRGVVDTWHVVLGAVCVVLAAGWLAFLLVGRKRDARRRG